MPALRSFSVCAKIARTALVMTGTDDDAIVAAVSCTCAIVFSAAEGVGGSVIVTSIEGVSFCESGADVPSIRAAIRCSPLFGFHSIEWIWLSPPGRSNSRAPMRVPSAVKTRVAWSAFEPPFNTMVDTTSISPSTADCFDTQITCEGNPACTVAARENAGSKRIERIRKCLTHVLYYSR